MKFISILFICIFAINSNIFPQIDNIISNNIDNDSIYISLLERHVQYLQSTSHIVNRLSDSTLMLLVPYPISRVFPDSISNRKIIIVDDSMLDSLSVLRRFDFIEIRPMYFKDKSINFVYGDISTIPKEDSFFYQVHGCSIFVFVYDCLIQDYILTEIRH